MKIETQPKIERGTTRLVIPHEDKEIIFAYLSIGPNDYRNVGKNIVKNNLLIPTGDQTASLVYAAYCSDLKDEPEFQNIRDLMRNKWLWTFNRNLWTNKGVYVFQDKEAKGRSESLQENELERLLESGEEIQGVRFSRDKTIRFAPKETYSLGVQNSLSRNIFIIASYGTEGAEKLEEVSTKFKCKPFVYGPEINENNNPELKVSALGVDVGQLHVDGDSFDGGRDGHAFGVL